MGGQRRTYSKSFKLQLIKESSQRGASIAGVALAHGINANLLHKWRRQHEKRNTPAPTALIPIAVVPEPVASTLPAAERSNAIEIELPRARITVRGAVDLDALQTVLAALRPR